VPWYLYFILHFSLHSVPAVYSVSSVQFSVYIRRRDGRWISISGSLTLAWLLIARCIGCRNGAINVLVCRPISQLAAAVCIPLLAHMASHKTSMGRNLTNMIVFDKLVASEALSVSSHAVLWVTLIPSNSKFNKTASSTGSAEAGAAGLE